MIDNSVLSDTLQQLQTEVTSTPSIVGDVMQRIEEKPMPVRCRGWNRTKIVAACTAAAACLAVAIGVWIVAGGDQPLNLASTRGNQAAAQQGDEGAGLTGLQGLQRAETADGEDAMAAGAVSTEGRRGAQSERLGAQHQGALPAAEASCGNLGNVRRGLVDDNLPWGNAVEGVQCRLLPQKSTWRAGQTPQLQADLRNRGKRELSMGLYPTSWEVEYDGVWYHATAQFSGGVELLRLKPGGQRNGIPLLLEERFEWLSKEDGLRLVFRPGRHALRAAFHLDADNGSGLRVLSNPAEVEILPATDDKPASNAEGPDRQRDIVLRGAAASCRHLCLDIDEDAKVEQIGGATSARCLRLAKGQLPVARWKLIETERGHLIQARAGKLAGWYLDFNNYAQIEEMGGATSSRNLLLTEQRVPGAYWKVTETDEGSLIQAQAGRFEGWYLDLDILTRQKVTGAFWQIEATSADTSTGDESCWGKPVEGVQCRLLPEMSTWQAGQTPRLQADLRNRGKREVNLGLAPENWEVQYDGVWYGSTMATVPSQSRKRPRCGSY